MTLQDFESKIDEVILERGRRYYSDNKVFNLLNPSPDLWTAYIHGSDKYAVQIYIINNEIITYRCTCPYNMGPTCKHIVATLFAIKNPVKSTEPPKSMAKKKTSAPKTGAVTQKVGLILEKASKEELSNFITSEFRYNSELKTSFLAHFEDYTKTESDDNYRQIVRSIRKSAQDRHGFIDYYNARKIVRPLQDLLIGAERLIETNNLKESLVIACTFIEEIPLMVAHMDDSDGSAGDLYYFAIQLVEQISELATPDIKEFIFKFLIKEYPKKKYHDFSFESPFLLQLSKAITTKKQELRFLKLIDSQITLLANAGHMDYKLSELVSTKTDYLLSASKEKEAWQLVNKYLHLSSLRAKQIEKEKLEQNYENAIELCLEGIKIAQEKQHRSDETNWKVELLNIAKQQNNAQDAQKWAKALMFDGKYIRMEFYEELKNTYAETEWPNKCEQIIADINNADDRIGASRNLVLPEIFLREHLWDRLITLVSQNTELTFVDHYAPFLQDQFPHEILDAYTQAIKIASQKVGRNAYKNIARYLAKMLTIQGGKEITAQLIHYLLNQYPTRKAMKEVFQTSFPEILSADSPKSPPSKPNMRLL